ncbi:MAG: replication-associated recombination protein A [Clostridia bacterium]|nr:replication-associated recombination protein A [Clostridia bacterium]
MNIPLADRLRPQSLDDIAGQHHLLDKNKPLRNIIESGQIPNMVFYGPSGVGKTTLASIIAKKTNRTLRKLNGTTATTADIRNIVSELSGFTGVNGILLYLDEIQYFNKKQQQTLLEFIENGSITLIASTTENPYFYVYSAILSRSTVFEFKSVEKDDVVVAVNRAFDFMRNELNEEIEVSEKAVEYIAYACGGDVRKAINAVELSTISTPIVENKRTITLETVKSLTQKSAMKYDREGDEHYDLLSAFQKSMRGSDPDAAIHYLARILLAGDLPSACRRLMVCACEDVGLANPNIIPIVKSAVDAAMMVGMPEARIPLADAVILVCLSPKSNSAYNAINQAMADVQAGKGGGFPRCLQNKHYDGDDVKNKGQFYKYPHDFPNHWTEQQYMPDNLKGTVYYEPDLNKTEQAYKNYWNNIKKNN